MAKSINGGKDEIDKIEYVLKILAQQISQIGVLIFTSLFFHIFVNVIVLILAFVIFRLGVFKRRKHLKNLILCEIVTTLSIIIPAIIFEGNLIMCAISGVVLAFITSDMPKRK